jgi:hypothetical protein
MYLRKVSTFPAIRKYAIKCVNEPIHPRLTRLLDDKLKTMTTAVTTPNGQDSAKENKQNLEFYLAPLCVPIKKFKSVEQIIHALWCVLQVLAKFHSDNCVHGDVRWGNIMYDVDTADYRLIDLDNGGIAPMKLTQKRKEMLRDLPERELVPILSKKKGKKIENI